MEGIFFIKIAHLFGLANWILVPPFIMDCMKRKSKFSISVVFILILFLLAGFLGEHTSIPDDLEKPYISYIASLFISAALTCPERPSRFSGMFSRNYLVLSAISLFFFAFLMFT